MKFLTQTLTAVVEKPQSLKTTRGGKNKGANTGTEIVKCWGTKQNKPPENRHKTHPTLTAAH